MKKLTVIVSMLVLLLMCITCGKEPQVPVSQLRITEGEKAYNAQNGHVTVVFKGTYFHLAPIKNIALLIGAAEDMSDAASHDAQIADSSFLVTASGLSSQKKYYYRYSVDYGGIDDFLTEVSTIVTPSLAAPSVTTAVVTEVTQTTALVGGEVTAEGDDAVTERGVCWGTEQLPTVEGSHLALGQGLGMFSTTLTGLASGKTYYVRAYAVSSIGTSYGEAMSFTTLADQLPTVTTTLATDITTTSALVGGTVIDEGSSSVTERGVCWAAHVGVSIEDSHASVGTGAGAFTYQITGLTSGTIYYYCAYATNAQGTVYGGEESFATSQEGYFNINVSAHPSNGGTVSGGGNYHQGDPCTVIATAADGYSFSNWTENGVFVSGDPNYTFTVTGNRSLVASFEVQAPNTYYINVSPNPSSGGTVSGGGNFQEGQSCTVHAVANTGYTFSNWTENGNVVSGNADYSFTVNGNRTLVANFTILSYTITVSADPSYGGTFTGGGTYEYGQTCTVAATPANGYTFLNWTENGTVVSESPNYNFTVTANRTLVAHFTVQAPNTYNINVSANPSNGGTVTGGGTYQQGQQCTVTATANTGYHFLRWTENGSEVSNSASYSFTVTGNRTLVAQFQIQSYTVEVSASPSNGGTVSGGGTYNYGQSCTVHASANTGYEFVNWTLNGNVVSTQPDYTFTVTNNCSLVAHFNQPGYTVTVSANPSNGGTVNGGGTYNQGASCTVTATPNSGYTFTNWTENGSVVSNSASYTFTVNNNRNLVANFTATPPPPQQYTITVTANPTNGGTVSGGGTYNYGQSCTVHAVANSGYVFANWTENGGQASVSANYTFTVTGNRTLVANFNVYQVNPPTVTTNTVANITETTATCGGNVTSDGGAAVTARGVCWSTSQNPTVSDNHTTDGTGTGSFISSITGLSPGTTYYVRAYATNSAGTAYGNQQTFSALNAGWLYYGSGDPHQAGLTTVTNFTWAVMFPPDMLSPFEGTHISKVKAYVYLSGTYTLTLYRGGTNAPSTQIHTQTFTANGPQWCEVNLSSSISLTTNQNLWVSISKAVNVGERPASSNNSPGYPNAKWYIDSSGNWVQYDPQMPICWMIQAYVTNGTKGDQGTYIGL